jgi:hypothetical protein
MTAMPKRIERKQQEVDEAMKISEWHVQMRTKSACKSLA